MFKKSWKPCSVLLLMLVLLVGCGTNSTAGSSSKTSGSKNKTYNIAVIVKATDSDFWQSVLTGAKAAAKDSNGKVKVTTYGPPSEKDIDQQVSILENVVSKQPDAIVLASTSSDATVPAIEDAMNQKIPVVLVDNHVNTDKFTSFLATNNIKGGAEAADQLVKALKDQGKELKGYVGVVSSMAGVQVLTDRDKGFLDRLKEIAPNIKPLATRYTDADITKALSATEDILTAHPDVLGFFADNNSSGDGVARGITERNQVGKIQVVAYDSDDEEIKAIQSGAIYSLIVQDPYGEGYKGVNNAVSALEGKSVQKQVDTGTTAVTKDNLNTDSVQKLLYPNKK